MKSKRKKILELAKKHGVKNIQLFGSVLKGEDGPESDVDFLVELEEGITLFNLGEFLIDLEELMGKRVDVVTKESLHWYIRDRIIAEAKPL